MTFEQFIAKNIDWIGLITALGSLAAAVSAIIVVWRGEKTTRSLMEKDHSMLDKNDSNLSKEHDKISSQIADKHNQIQRQQDEIKQTVTYLKENALIEQAKIKMLSQQISEHISALVDLLHNTQIENQQLRKELQELKFKIHQYEIQFNSEDEMEP